jgi:hypothetical protein
LGSASGLFADGAKKACGAVMISRSIDNARSDERQCVQNPPEAAMDLEGFSGESFLVFDR